MATFKEFFKFEWKRFFGKRNLIIFAVLFLVVLAVTLYNVKLYEKKIEQKKIMIEFEKKRVQHFIDYRYYGNYGFRVSVMNEPMDIWSFASVPFPDMQADVDTSERLKIYTPLQGATAFSMKLKWLLDFTGILLLFGGILAFLYGFETFYYKKFLKFLASFTADGRSFFFIALSRIIMLTLLYLALIAFSYLIIAVSGISIPFTWKLPVLFLTAIVTTLVFFGLGTWFGQFKKMWVGLLSGGIIWFVSTIFFPAAINMVISGKAINITTIYEIELEKLIILSDFEKRSIQKAGKLPYGVEPADIHKELAVSYLRNEFMRILEHDQNMMYQMEKNVSLFKKLAMLIPTTNYLSINYDLNTHGYKSLLVFYRKVLDVKRGFMKYYIDAAYSQKKEIVEPFLKDEEILFKYESQLTWEIPGGIVISLIFFLAFMTGAWRWYKKTLYHLPKKDKNVEPEEDIKMDSGFICPFDVDGDLFEKQLYCLYSGHGKEFVKKGYNYKIILDNKDMKDNTEKLDFLFLPHIKTFPGDVKAGALLDLAFGLIKMGKKRGESLVGENSLGPVLNTTLGKLSTDGLGRVSLALFDTRVFKHYIISDALVKMTAEFVTKLKDRTEELTDDGANVVFLTSDFLCGTNFKKPLYYFKKDSMVFTVLESLRTQVPKPEVPDKPGNTGDKDESDG